jgi:hypothetical protein
MEVEDSLEYLEQAAAAKQPRLLAQLRQLALNEAFLRLAHALDEEARTLVSEVLNTVPSDLATIHAREQMLGQIKGLQRLSQLHNDLIKKLENEENEQRGTTTAGRDSGAVWEHTVPDTR